MVDSILDAAELATQSAKAAFQDQAQNIGYIHEANLCAQRALNGKLSANEINELAQANNFLICAQRNLRRIACGAAK